MTRRRVLALIFGALIVIFVGGSVVTVAAVRAQLIDDVDDSLRAEVSSVARFLEQVDDVELERFASPVNERALVRVDPLGVVEFAVPAGSADAPVAPPDLPPSRIIDRVGDVFNVDGTDGGPNYRVISAQLADGDFIAIAQPLDDVRSTVSSLARILLVTLFAMLLVLGAIFWWLLRLSLRPYDDMIDAAQAIADGDLGRRVTEVETDPNLARLTASLNTMLDRLQTSFDAKEAAEDRVKQFAADASHELRTPLTTIAGYSELHLSGAATDAESTTKQMTRIHSEATRMGRLVNDLLVLARLDQGRVTEFQPVDIASIVAAAVEDRRVVDPAQALTYTSRVAPDPGVVVGDPDALHQLFVNLLANTTVHAAGAAVDVDVDVDAHAAVVTVRDAGPGMSPATAARVFDRFFRADRARTTSARSSGLGLSIVAAIVEAHGGTIDVDTAPDRGATFTIRLPTTATPQSGD